jgi:hypothetical protein
LLRPVRGLLDPQAPTLRGARCRRSRATPRAPRRTVLIDIESCPPGRRATRSHRRFPRRRDQLPRPSRRRRRRRPGSAAGSGSGHLCHHLADAVDAPSPVCPLRSAPTGHDGGPAEAGTDPALAPASDGGVDQSDRAAAQRAGEVVAERMDRIATRTGKHSPPRTEAGQSIRSIADWFGITRHLLVRGARPAPPLTARGVGPRPWPVHGSVAAGVSRETCVLRAGCCWPA